MKKSLLVTASLLGSGIIAATSIGVVAAAPNSTANVGTSGIPRTVFQQEKQDAVAEVLNTTTANVQAARKDHTLKQLISNAGLTPKTFAQKVKTQLTTDLEAKGYSQEQVTIALQHKQIGRLHHKIKAHHKN